VEGHLAGRSEDEILLQAHLCHPRPGANDNASGVCALLGIAETVQSLTNGGLSERIRGIRFLWGPELIGTAAYLHDLVGEGRRMLPLCALNLDMVGEDQHRCGGPLILESSPDHVPSFIDALAERCVELLPQEGLSYSGAVPTATWAWRTTPFVGASDHSLFADRSIARPAIQLGHWPDRFNHTSADTVDKVDPDELRRAATAAGATTLLISLADGEIVHEIERIVAQWGARKLAEVVQAGTGAGPRPPGVLDPYSTGELWGLLEHAEEVVTQALEATADLATNGASSDRKRLLAWLRRQAKEQAHFLLRHRRTLSEQTSGPYLKRRWSGPFNLQALLERSPQREADWIALALANDGAAYGTMLALALAIDDRSPRQAVIRRASYSSRLSIKLDSANRFFDLLEREGWIEEI
jgi:hypothetical protein